MLTLLTIFCLSSLTLARHEPSVYLEGYEDGNDYFGKGGHGSANDIVLLGGGSRGGSYTSEVGGYGDGEREAYGSHSGDGSQSGGYQQAPIVQKHIYVHISPPENEYIAPQQVIPPPPPKVHYKIVFIKAPTVPQQPAPLLPAPQQDQEKTLIYVLHKQPADTPLIVIPTPQPTAPSKPEVYFIRYKTHEELSVGPTHGSHVSSTTLAPHYSSSSTFSPVSSSLGHTGSSAISIVPCPAHPTSRRHLTTDLTVFFNTIEGISSNTLLHNLLKR